MLVHHSRLPTWPRNCLQDPYFWALLYYQDRWIQDPCEV